MTNDRAIAEAATPGPWSLYEDAPRKVAADTERWEAYSTYFSYKTASLTNHRGEFHEMTDATHIAHFNPAKIIKMLDEIESLRAQLEIAREALTLYAGYNSVEVKGLANRTFAAMKEKQNG